MHMHTHMNASTNTCMYTHMHTHTTHMMKLYSVIEKNEIRPFYRKMDETRDHVK